MAGHNCSHFSAVKMLRNSKLQRIAAMHFCLWFFFVAIVFAVAVDCCWLLCCAGASLLLLLFYAKRSCLLIFFYHVHRFSFSFWISILHSHAFWLRLTIPVYTFFTSFTTAACCGSSALKFFFFFYLTDFLHKSIKVRWYGFYVVLKDCNRNCYN